MSLIQSYYLERIAISSLLKSSEKKLNLRHRLSLSENSKLLDYGCGFGNSTIQAENDGFIALGFDTSTYKIRFAKPFKKRKKAHFIIASAGKAPFRKNSFDVVYCNHVLEHLSDDNLALNEIWNILKNKGFLVLTVPNKNNLATSLNLRMNRKFPYTDKTHFREYGEAALKNLLRKNCFTIIETTANDFVPPIASKLFHFLVIYLQLKGLTGFLAKGFPKRSLEIQIIASKTSS